MAHSSENASQSIVGNGVYSLPNSKEPAFDGINGFEDITWIQGSTYLQSPLPGFR
jgi:hypothetical protein